MSQAFIALVGGMFLFIVGLYALRRHFKLQRIARASAAWEVGTATVTDSTLEALRTRYNTFYRPRVSYTYMVGGQQYFGTVHDPLANFMSQAKAEALIQRY